LLIHDNWKIRWFDEGEVPDLAVADPDYTDHFWLPAKVPGDVHSTLLENGLIDHPYFGHNDQKCRWVERKVWWYRTEFAFDGKEPAKDERLELIFEGLDTFATVYLNGKELGTAENMFIPHIFDVTREIRKGRNVLAVKFSPVADRVKGKEKNYWSGFSKDRIWVRKAQYQFGWDWCPPLVSAGIWQAVRLERRKRAKIESVYARTLKADAHSAEVNVEIQVKTFVNGLPLAAEISLKNGGEEVTARTSAMDGDRMEATLQIRNPKLWWTHDLGEPHLYRLTVRLLADGETVDRREREIGIRTIGLKREDEKGKPRFTFVLNGKELFAKGANWIPVDLLLGSAPESRYKHLIRLAKEANMNMLRVWGGGIYEKDVFYRECDRQGILVWQDFMFACALYPDYNRNFMENVRKEVAAVIRRLRNHPCLALWCGNNENDWLYEVGVSAGEIRTPFYGEKIYHELIPELLARLDPSRPYWPSSPYGGNDHNSQEEGDRHNWQVWHGNVEPRKFGENLGQNLTPEGVSFRNFRKDRTRFSSEFGIHASANRHTLEKYLPPGSLHLGSGELSYRNKDFHQEKGFLLMEGFTGIPKDFREYFYFSMMTQAEGLKYGVEHYRRNMPETSGTLIWQLNDCWPGTSWSMIDYCLLPKASYYYSKKFFAPFHYSVEHDPGENLKIWVTNDSREKIEDTLLLEVHDFYGGRIFAKTFPVSAEAGRSAFIAELAEAEILRGCPAERAVIRLKSLGQRAEDNFHYLRNHKELDLPKAKLDVRKDPEKGEITVRTDRFARFVHLDVPGEGILFSDNFFDLLPGEEKRVKIASLDGGAVALEYLTVSAVNGTDGEEG